MKFLTSTLRFVSAGAGIVAGGGLLIATFGLSVSTASGQSLSRPGESSPLASMQPLAQANRVGTDFSTHVQLKGHIPSWARAERQVAKPVDPTQQVMLSIVLNRDPAVQAAFTKLLADQQDPRSLYYHQWLKPQQVGELFGPTQADVDALSGWLTSQGLKVQPLAPNRVLLRAYGTTAAIGTAFRTSYGYYLVNDVPRLAVHAEPTVPAALVPLIASIHGLSESHNEPNLVKGSRGVKNGSRPSFADGSQNGSNQLGPADFNRIYDLDPVHNGGNLGATIGATPQRVAVIGRSFVETTDILNYTGFFGIGVPSGGVTSIFPNNSFLGQALNPGSTNDSDQDEATLDVTRVIGTAPGAAIDMVASETGALKDGIEWATEYQVETLVDPIMNISFGGCEQDGDVGYWNSEITSAAAEGVSVFVSAGDAGAAGCDTAFKTSPNSQELGVNDICASIYATCVGGTEFNDTSNTSTYWSSSDGPHHLTAISYIPEGVWNETGPPGKYQAIGGGGGISGSIGEPIWQAQSPSVPFTNFRNEPDLAFSAAYHDGYFLCEEYEGEDCYNTSTYFAGTSAAAPGMAGIAALINQAMGSAQGNMNPLIYRIANSTATAFHDVTVASSGVSNCSVNVPSICNNSVPNGDGSGVLAGYAVAPGFDLATGWGSMDVNVFISVATAPPAATTLEVTTSSQILGAAQPRTFTATISSPDTISVPSGTVQFYLNGQPLVSPVTVTGPVATLTTTLAEAGTQSITATYSGDPSFEGSTSPAITVVVPDASYVIDSAVSTGGDGLFVDAILAAGKTFYYPTSAYFIGSGARFFAVQPSGLSNGLGQTGGLFGAEVNFNPTYVPADGSLFYADLVLTYEFCPEYPNTIIPNFSLCGSETTYTSVAGQVTGSNPIVGAQIQFSPTAPVPVVAAAGAKSAAADQSGNIYIGFASTVDKYTNGTMTPIAGNGTAGYGGDGGPALEAQVNGVDGLLANGTGVLLSDTQNNVTRGVYGAGIQNVAGLYYPPSYVQSQNGQGNGICGTTSGNYVFVSYGCYSGYTMGVAPYEVFQVSGSPYVLGTGYGITGTFPTGPGNYMTYPTAMATDGLNLYIADTNNNVIRQLNPQGTMYTLAGVTTCPDYGYTSTGALTTQCEIYPGDSGDGGFAWNAHIQSPTSIAVDPYGNVFIASTPSPAGVVDPYIENFLLQSTLPYSNVIRMIGTDNIIRTPTLAGLPLTGTGLVFDHQGNLYITGNDTAPYYNSTDAPIEKVTLESNGTPLSISNWAPYSGYSPSFDKTGAMILSDGTNINQVGGTGYLTFPQQNIGHTSPALTATITNPGGSPLIIISANGITGFNAADFKITKDTCSAQAIVPGGTCVVAVTYTPSTNGAENAAITVLTNVGTGTQTINLKGTTVPPIMLTSPTLVPGYEFGTSIGTLKTTASGGTPPYTFSLDYPVGSGQWTLTPNGTSATLSGYPFVTGSVPITITATDSLGITGSVLITLSVRQAQSLMMFSGTQTPTGTGTSVAYASNVVFFGGSPAGTPPPTGTVKFQFDYFNLPTGTLVNGTTPTATVTTDILYHQIYATYSGDSNYNNEFATASYAINGGRAQTISFPSGLNVPVGTTMALTAVASSGLPVTYQVMYGSAVLDSSGTNLVVEGPGVIGVQATQVGNPSFAAATAVNATFNAY